MKPPRIWRYLKGRSCLAHCGEGHTYGIGCLLGRPRRRL